MSSQMRLLHRVMCMEKVRTASLSIGTREFQPAYICKDIPGPFECEGVEHRRGENGRNSRRTVGRVSTRKTRTFSFPAVHFRYGHVQ
jgi:hypothetical protein